MVISKTVSRKDAIIGRTFTNRRGHTCVVLDTLSELDAGDRLHLVKFLETGTKKILRATHLYNQEFKDNCAPSVYGVGYLGEATCQNDAGKTKRLYHMWKRMIGMCYHETYRDYSAHGQQGETVCESWHCFATFEQDVKNFPEFDQDGGLYLVEGHSTWSKENCAWRTR